MTTKHPIDHAIVAALFLVEGICWIINELAGFHKPEPEVVDPREIFAVETGLTFYEEPAPDEAYVARWERIEKGNDLAALTVKELRAQAKGLAKGIHLMRKQELISLLV